MNYKHKLIFLFIFFLAAAFRLTGINWDQGFHLHPDERAIVLAVTPLHLPTSWSQFLSAQSPLNPHFFAYGSFPMYLLKFTGFLMSYVNPLFSQYDLINLLGRFLSASFDLGTLFILFLLGRRIVNTRVGLLAAFFYAVSVLPIQLSHFYAVDTQLTFFLILTLYLLIRFYEKASFLKAMAIGACIGFAFATKISATVILVSVVITLIADFGLLIIKHPLHPSHWLKHIPKFLFSLIKDLFIMFIVGIAMYAILEPYAFIDFTNFWQQTLAQSAMTKNAFIFPYTLQYVTITPYFYELKNIFLWGLGPILATICFLGVIYGTYMAIMKHRKQEKWAQDFILLAFFWAYFLTVGSFAIGFMRYMLPLYPLFCLFGAMYVFATLNDVQRLFRRNSARAITSTFGMEMIKSRWSFVICYLLFVIVLLVWPVSFMHIYSQPNMRVEATNYINQMIPEGETLAVEHWDDELPLASASNYRVQTLPLYDPDTPEKWTSVDQQLKESDYLIIASNRLYVPLHKLANCQKYAPPHCYPITDQYYQNLFAGKPVAPGVTFKEIKEFVIYPTIPFLNIPINDQGADESFTVYDHPKVMIFKKQ